MEKAKTAWAPPEPLLDYLRLLRIPNVFTAWADIFMGFAFVYGALGWAGPPTAVTWTVLALLVLASSLLYLAGMVLNDVFDYDIDLKERPERPLPAGRVPLGAARTLGYAMLAGGVIAGCLAGFVGAAEGAIAWRAGVIAALLAGCVYAYDAFLKKTPAGPIGMGACRFFNVLLGMSVAVPPPDGANWLLAGYEPAQLTAALAIGVYIAGVTWFARTEATESNRLHLIGGLAVMMAGLLLLYSFPHLVRYTGALYLPSRFVAGDWIWPLLVAMLAFTLVRRSIMAVIAPSPGHVQAAVTHCLTSLIFLDAAAALMVSNPGPAIGILILLAPMILLGKWVYST